MKKAFLFPGMLSILFIVFISILIIGCDKDDEEEEAPSNTYVYDAVRSHCDPLMFVISADQTVTITTTDSVITNINGGVADCDYWTDADGIPDCHYIDDNPDLHGLPFMALIGEYGGEYFLVGTSYQNTFASADTLKLSVNDWGGCGDDSDNVGQFVITVLIE